MFRKLGEFVERNSFDIVHVDHLHMAVYGVFLNKQYGLPIVLREHNVEFAIMERFANNQKNSLLCWYAKLQYTKLLKYEPEICSKFDRCVMITAEDERRIRAMSDRVRTTVIPAGVDLPAIANHAQEESKSILFLASLDWLPNVDGFFWFHEKVLPLVLHEEPEIVLSVVGNGHAPRLANLRHPNIRFIGFVDDVAPYIWAAQVCVVPLLAGGGIRIKILEMFAHGKCVVSTSVGCEGIEVENGRELLIADEPVEFASSIVSVLRNQDLRMSIGNNARRLVERKYAWRQIGAAFEKAYIQCLNERNKGFPRERD
jgi:glycosyltransferase involved in cell wall biosynthesis